MNDIKNELKEETLIDTIATKLCRQCNNTKPLTLFNKSSRTKDGVGTQCKECNKKYLEKWTLENKEYKSNCEKQYRAVNKSAVKEYQRKYYLRNKEILLTKNKIYRKENENQIKLNKKHYRDTHKKEQNIWYHKNKHRIQFRIIRNLRGRLSQAIKHSYKSGSAIKDLGCSIPELKLHLESKFQSGMTWDNYGKYGWHIDHIKPLSSFDLTNREQVLMACHYTNLQPLWAIDNMIKNKY